MCVREREGGGERDMMWCLTSPGQGQSQSATWLAGVCCGSKVRSKMDTIR